MKNRESLSLVNNGVATASLLVDRIVGNNRKRPRPSSLLSSNTINNNNGGVEKLSSSSKSPSHILWERAREIDTIFQGSGLLATSGRRQHGDTGDVLPTLMEVGSKIQQFIVERERSDGGGGGGDKPNIVG